MVVKKVSEETTFRTCGSCGVRFLHHYFKVCDECRGCLEDRNAFIPSQRRIKKMCRAFKKKGVKKAKKRKGTDRLDCENNFRYYEEMKQGAAGRVMFHKQGMV